MVKIKESSIRRTLRLDDAEGTSCLSNIEIFEGLAKMGYEKPSDKLTFYKAFFSPQWKFLIHTLLQCLSAKTTTWNEFSSTMAFAIICLATNQKINFSRYILLSLVKNIEVGVPFFMLLRFIQLIINHQLDDITHHKEIFDTPSLTKKVFANMKRKKHKPKKKPTQEYEVPSTESPAEQTLPSPSNDPLPSGEDSLKLKELIDFCTNFIEKLEGMVAWLEEENKVLKELKNAHSTDDDVEPVMEKEKSSKQGRKIADIDADVEINLEKDQAEAYNLDLDHQEKVLSMMDVNEEDPADVEEVLEVVKVAKLMTEVVTTAGATKLDEEVTRQLQAELNADIKWNDVIEQVKRNERLNDVVMKYQTLKRKPLTQAQARRNMIVYLKNMTGFKMDYFKGMTYDEIRPFFEKHYNYNQAFLDEVNEGVKVSETEVESSKRESESLEQEITKKQKMEEETKELKKNLQIVTDDDDDVYTNATLWASKIPIIDYKIHTERNRPYIKIIRADGNHMLFISLSTMLKNFDREDLESLWIIIRDRFEKTKPKNYSDDYLLNTLKIMFEKPNVEASIFLLVEKMYPLTHFTLEQMLNDVRLQVEEESEMSLELLRLVRRRLNEGPRIGMWSGPNVILHGFMGCNIVTNSRVTPSWREIVSLTILVKLESYNVNWTSYRPTA
nr:hypothetical protein [Tanacetum cinerariifolium]